MDVALESLLDRADELFKDLEKEYEKCLHSQEVTERAKNITHEVLEKLRNALDQTMWKAWDKYIAPNISSLERGRARVYFPIAGDLHSFRSTFGRGYLQSLEQHNKELYDFLLKRQPFYSRENHWLDFLATIAAKKHVGLAPQKRSESRRTKVSRNGVGSVSWDQSAVTYETGVSILGAQINPKTQRIIPTHGVTEQVEIWVNFTFEGYDVNANGFCKEACEKTRKLIEDMVKLI
jgi:hypothetical protein